MKLVSCVGWVGRGVAAAKPHRVRLDKAQITQLLTAAEPTPVTETSEASDTEQPSSSADANGLRGSVKDRDSDSNSDAEPEQPRKKKKSAGAEDRDDVEDDEEEEESGGESAEVKERYGLGTYDAEDDEKRNGLSGIACFASSKEDPYIDAHADSDKESSDDSSEEGDNWRLKPSDNLLLLAKVDRDEFSIQVFVHNADAGDLYCHHDYPLPAPPLALAHIAYDPSSAGGNMCAVGTMEPEVGLYDLDLLDTVEPVISLAAELKTTAVVKNGKRKLRKKRTGIGHSDAVTALAWNALTPHVLASGSADSSVVLWDLDSEKGAAQLRDGDAESKVFGLDWHPAEASLLIAAGSCGTVRLWDCRQSAVARSWDLGGEAELLLWDRGAPFNFFASDGDGGLGCWDSRTEKALWTHESVHGGSLSGLVASPALPGALLTTSGEESALKLWRASASGLASVGAAEPKLGNLHSLAVCPDDGWTLAIGGSSGDNFRVFNIANITGAKEAFGSGEN